MQCDDVNQRLDGLKLLWAFVPRGPRPQQYSTEKCAISDINAPLNQQARMNCSILEVPDIAEFIDFTLRAS